MKLDDWLNDLKVNNKQLSAYFIDNLLVSPPNSPSFEEEISIKAFCLLSCAAIEEYLENIALFVLENAIGDFISTKKISITLISLLGYYRIGFDVEKDDNEFSIIYDYIRKAIEKVKGNFSSELHNNNGISLKNIKQLFIPIGIDIPQDLNLLNSMNHLSIQRGDFAHLKTARKYISAKDAKDLVSDCINFCEKIKQNAYSVINP